MARTHKVKNTVSRAGTRISNETQGRRALLFNEVNPNSQGKNVFDLSHSVSTSGQMGNLMPLNIIKCVPGDIHKIGQQPFMRLAPMISPPMTQVNMSIHNWFIPTRLLWGGFEDYIAGVSGASPMPYYNITNAATAAQKRFLDYMGIPPIGGAGTTTPVCALPLAAYQYLYNEKYRDQNLISEVVYKIPDAGGDVSAMTQLLIMRKVAWEHDLFTSALPSAAFGAEVAIPLGEVELNPDWYADSEIPKMRDITGALVSPSGDIRTQSATGGYIETPATTPIAYDPFGSLEINQTTIKELRQALKKQEFLELLARGGKRYYEVLERFWDVRTSDERFQQPEYINGLKTPVMISEVLNTAGKNADSASRPLGDMAGHGISVGRDEGKNFFCEEYGYIVSVMFVTPKSGYNQGIPKHWLELDHYDYGNWPQFEHIGEQELTLQELYAYTAAKDSVFGYVPRNAHMKYMADRISGDMRDSTKLEHWTMNRTFTSAPTLGQTFIEVNPTDDSIVRVFTVQDGSDYLYFDIWQDIRSVRPFSVFGNPQL